MSLKLSIYNQNCLDLSKSFLIKSELLARHTEYQLLGGLQPLNADKRTWLYYMNMAGLYHPSNEPMYITSHDTLTTIKFDKAMLAEHSITKSKYLITSDLTNKLIALYPNNTTLIMGIIYDLDIDTIIEAEDYSILAYDKNLIASHEYRVICAIEEGIRGKFGASLNKDYADIEPGYIDVLIWKLYQSLPYEVKFARLRNHRTAWAAEYDMWTFINSRIYLEDLNYALTHNDLIYLYKNIDRLCFDSGSNRVLDELIQRFLTDQGVSSYQLMMVKDLSSYNDLSPEFKLDLIERSIATGAERPASIEEYTDLGDARSHTTIPNYTESLTTRMMKQGDMVTTRELKILEILENSSDTQVLLTDIDLFVQACGMGVYNYRHSIMNHITGDSYQLITEEAIVLYMYAVGAKLGNHLTNVTTYDTHVVPKTELPTVNELVSRFGISTEIAEALISRIVPYPKKEISKDELDAYIVAYKASLANIKVYLASITNYHNQPYIGGLEAFLFCRMSISLMLGEVKYSDWFVSQQMNFDSFDVDDWVILEDNILREVFKLDLIERTSHRSIGIAELIKRFCSYRVNVTARADSSNLIDYYLSPIYSNHTVVTDNHSTAKYLTPITMKPSAPTYHIGINSAGSSAQPKPPIIGESTSLMVNCGGVGASHKSTVISDSVTHINLHSRTIPTQLIE